MNLYAMTISSVICVQASSPAEAVRLAHHYSAANQCGHDWEVSAPEVCNAESLPAGWSERDRVVGPHAMTVGDVLQDALDALSQWKHAEEISDNDELANARTARDKALA
jgi:hypothetical protein